MLQRIALWTSLLLAIGLLLCSGFCHPDIRPISLSALATGIAAFVGAYVAFMFEKERREKILEDDRYRELRFAHLVVLIQHQKLSALKANYLSKWQDETSESPKPKPTAWRRMTRLSEMPTDRTIELDRLAFILESDNPNLLHEIEKGQFLFRSYMNLLKERNELYRLLQQAISRLAADPPPEEEGRDEALVNRRIGVHIVEGLKSATVNIFCEHPKTVLMLERNRCDIEALIQASFPKRRPAKVSFPDDQISDSEP